MRFIYSNFSIYPKIHLGNRKIISFTDGEIYILSLRVCKSIYRLLSLMTVCNEYTNQACDIDKVCYNEIPFSSAVK